MRASRFSFGVADGVVLPPSPVAVARAPAAGSPCLALSVGDDAGILPAAAVGCPGPAPWADGWLLPPSPAARTSAEALSLATPPQVQSAAYGWASRLSPAVKPTVGPLGFARCDGEALPPSPAVVHLAGWPLPVRPSSALGGGAAVDPSVDAFCGAGRGAFVLPSPAVAAAIPIDQPRAALRAPSPGFVRRARAPRRGRVLMPSPFASVAVADEPCVAQLPAASGSPRACASPVPEEQAWVAEPRPIPAGLCEQSWQLAPDAFKRGRKRLTQGQLATLVSQEHVELYRRDKAASWLVDALSQPLVDYMVAGEWGAELALMQVPDPLERRAALRQTFLLKAGPDGAALGKARRALEELVLFAPSAHLPASAVLLNRLITHVDERSRKAARGSQGGTTVGALVRSGLVLLAALGFPVEARHISVDAAAPPARKRRRERRSGSLPIAFYCHFELKASHMVASPARFFARSLCLGWLFASLRLVDTFRVISITIVSVDEDGCPVLMVVTSFSKDGAPIDVYLRAEGFLGVWPWARAHVAELAGSPFILPAFAAPKGFAGDVRFATGFLRREDGNLLRVCCKAHACKSIKGIASEPPLSMTGARWKELELGFHSAHGSPSDQAAVIGEHAPPEVAMTPADENELGLWRRRATARSGDAELPLCPVLEQALGASTAQSAAPGAPRPVAAAAAPGVAAEDAAMRVRYTSGTNREGRRRAQVRVRARWTLAVRWGLAKFGQPWTALSGDRSDYDILERLERPQSAD